MFFFFVILTLSPTDNRAWCVFISTCSGYIFRQTWISFFFLLASTGVILIDECLVLLYCSTKSSSTSWNLQKNISTFFLSSFYSIAKLHSIFPRSRWNIARSNSWRLCYKILNPYQPKSLLVFSLWISVWMQSPPISPTYLSKEPTSHIWRKYQWRQGDILHHD